MLSFRFPLFCCPLLAGVAWLLTGAGCSRSGGGPGDAALDPISFNAHVRPILVQNCTSCHGGVKKAGGVSYVYREEALGTSESGRVVITPGSPEKSELYRRITTTDELERMPPVAHGEALSDHDIAVIEKWISDGAQWEEHWAYQAPVVQAAPESGIAQDWVRHDIDRYVLAGMEAHGLQPNPEADRARLLRRLSLDLTGLPPTWSQVEAFRHDDAPDAFEREVDRLLASPAFGERWATPWLDLARYADTMGYERDPAREVWPFRDWVIRTLNQDMPFDEFTRMQLAGDLQDDAGLDDLVATGFHRNSMVNVEGGSDDEEFRLAAVMDRVNTTWQAWMGTTFGCVQCHSHPYDPFPQESYYRFMALFDNDWDHDTGDDYPTIGYATQAGQRANAFSLQRQADAAGRAYQRPLRKLALSSDWHAVRYRSTVSTRGVTIAIERDKSGRQLLQTGPNVPKQVVHTIRARSDRARLEALRVDALMLEGASVAEPGPPFVVSYFELKVQSGQGDPRSVKFDRVVPDEYGHRTWPERSLVKSDRTGWGAYPKQHYPRWAVFVPESPVELAEHDELELVIHHDRHHDGAAQPVLRRFRISLSDDPRWSAVSHSPAVAVAAQTRRAALDTLAQIELVNQPVLRRRHPDYSRVTNLFIRGDWRSRGPRVAPGVPALWGGNRDSVIDRAQLGEWLVSDQNPLTSRFTVNRYWEQLFGRGLMADLGDFGSASSPPSHPELLDYLAIQFRSEWGWSLKRLLREMVTTATYRQSAVVDATAARIDPLNVWLSRGPRTRLSAEMIRDNALQVAGLLADKMYGPPVMPRQPEGIWRTPYSKTTWETSAGEDQYRRAVYTFWKRTVPYPSAMTFDAPSREVCTPRRVGTNTPLQALVMLNDPVYWECAEQLAARVKEHGGNDIAGWIDHAFRRVLLRDATAAEREDLTELYTQLSVDAPGSHALQLTMSAILNLDDFLTK